MTNTTASSEFNASVGRKSRSTGWQIFLGILLVIAALFVFGAVAWASTALILFFGWVLLIGGVIQFFSIFFVDRNRLAYALFGILNAVIGYLFVANPTYTLGTLTLLLGMVLTIGGVFRMVSSPFGVNRGWNFFGGLISFILGLMIWIHWPTSSLYTFGLFLGVYLLIAGISELAGANQNRNSLSPSY